MGEARALLLSQDMERALFLVDRGGAETKHGSVLTATGHFAQ